MDEDPIAYPVESEDDNLPVATCLDVEITISECMQNLKKFLEVAQHCGRRTVEVDMN